MAKKVTKRKPVSRRDQPEIWLTVVKVTGLVALVAVLLGGVYALSLIGPAPVAIQDIKYIGDQPIPANVSKLLDQSNELEHEYDENVIIGQRTPTADDLAKLALAIKLQQDYLDQSHNTDYIAANARLDKMRKTLQTAQAEPLYQQSEDLQSRAKDLEKNEDYAGAISLLQKALDLETQINEQYHQSKYQGTALDSAALITRHIQYLTALPLSQQSKDEETAARAALSRQDWANAIDHFQKARDVQARLNREFSNQPFVDTGRLERLDNELVSLHSLPDHNKIEKFLADAQTANAAGDNLRAAELYQEALRQQHDLINNFQKSRFANPSILETIDTAFQISESRTLANEIKRLAANVADDLRHRHLDQALPAIQSLAFKIEGFHSQFPRSNLLNPELQQHFQFLNFKAADIKAIQDAAYGQILPIPGQKTVQLYKQEVPQSLYYLVVASNPSRSQNPNLPVETVSYLEAEKFLQRLAWLLGRPVRFPTADEFHAAVGNLDALDVSATTWNMDNSGGATQPVATKAPNANGFYDLLGNVEEWLQRPDSLDETLAPVTGGNVQSPVDTIRNTPVVNLGINERNRYIGFRFTVDTDDAQPLLPSSESTTPPPPKLDINPPEKAENGKPVEPNPTVEIKK